MGFAEDKEEDTILPPEKEEDEDPLKWEKMFRAPMLKPPNELLTPDFTPSGKFSKDPKTTTMTARNSMSSSETTSSAMKSEIRVVTFDLDNTIWKTSATISDANDALSEYLRGTFGIDERSEKRMGKLFQAFPDRYAGIDFAEGGSSAIVAGQTDINNPAEKDGTDDANADANSDVAGVHIQASFDDDNNNQQGQGGGGRVTKKPVYLTRLRKDAIRSLLRETNNDDDDNDDDRDASSADLENEVDAAFELWVEARCRSISRNFAPSAVPTLVNLRSRLGSHPSDGNENDDYGGSTDASPPSSRKVYVGAITDGNSDPDRVVELSGAFDFLIRAEDVGASKPDRRVYRAAVAALMARLVRDGRNVEEFFLGESGSGSDEEGGDGDVRVMDTYLKSNSRGGVVVDDDDDDNDDAGDRPSPPGWKDVEEEAVEAFSEAVGSWWVHVGDDFFKDVVAAKEFQMRTVWTRELIGGSDFDNNNKNDSVKSDSKKKERSVTDLVNDVSKSKDGILTMSIGASEFLTNSLHEEFSDAILDRFGDLSGLLMRWHEEGGGEQPAGGVVAAPAVSPVNDDVGVGTDAAVVSDPGDLETSGAAAAATDGVSESRQSAEDAPEDGAGISPARKFCVFCGAKLPAVAKFCSSCGERQV